MRSQHLVIIEVTRFIAPHPGRRSRSSDFLLPIPVQPVSKWSGGMEWTEEWKEGMKSEERTNSLIQRGGGGGGGGGGRNGTMEWNGMKGNHTMAGMVSVEHSTPAESRDMTEYGVIGWYNVPLNVNQWLFSASRSSRATLFQDSEATRWLVGKHEPTLSSWSSWVRPARWTALLAA